MENPILIFQNGPQKGHSFPLEDETTIGRDQSNSIRIEDQLVSRNHCKIFKDGDNYKITDLNSKNGIFLNGLPVTEAQISAEDHIKIGETVLIFHYKAINAPEDVSIEPHSAKQTIIVHKLPKNVVRDIEPGMLKKLIEEKHLQDLTALYHVSFSIYTIRDIDKLLKKVLELIFRAVPAERGVILLFDKLASTLVPRATRVKDSSQESVIKISSTIANEAFSENAALLTKDALSDKRYEAKKSILGESIRSAMCVPIGTRENTFGVIYLDTKTTTAAFNEDTLCLVAAISNQVAIAIENINFHLELESAANTLRKELKQVYNMVGVSKQIKDVFSQISKVSATDSTVLVSGESGTGKELVARAIHYNSPRNNKLFVCINCTALPETLIESELFGHEKGAFTGAYITKPGQFELADGGTIFLDEIGEMPLPSQTKLLRVLEENKIRHVGGTKDVPVNVRIIAASNKDLEKEVKENKFREDLFYRLKVIYINIAPLRERKEDIPLLAQYYFDKYKPNATHPIKGFSKEALQIMAGFSWPGNVRQLKNCVERAVVMGKNDFITPQDMDIAEEEVTAQERPSISTLADMEKAHIEKALEITNGNKTQTAELLGIRRSTLYEKIKLYNLE